MDRQRQRGLSLISLMIGLLVSLMAVMGMMALYRTVVHTTAESGVYAQLAGDRSAALLAAHSYVQAAGFGIDDAAVGTDLGVCTPNNPEAGLSGSGCAPQGRGRLLLWRLADGAMRCAGLHITAAGGLEYLQPQACVGGIASASWTAGQRQSLFTPGSLAAGFVELESRNEPCQALGVAGKGAVLVRLQARHPVAADVATDTESVPVYSSTCLVNFK